MSVAIIANPLAGRGRGQKAARLVEELLAARNADFQLLYTEYAGHAIELARTASAKHHVVAALGGDGTIREVLAGAWQSSAAIGIIPGGTGNDYARGLGIPRQVGPAVQILLEGHTGLFDVGMESDRVFGQMACIGFPVDVLHHVNNNRDGFWKGSAAFLAGVVATQFASLSGPDHYRRKGTREKCYSSFCHEHALCRRRYEIHSRRPA